MRKVRGSIQWKIIVAMLIVGLLPGFVGVTFTYLSGTKALKESMGSNFKEIAINTAENIEIIINREIYDAQTLAISPSIIAVVKEANISPSMADNSAFAKELSLMNEYIAKYKRKRDDVVDIAIADKKGRIIATTVNSLVFPFHGGKPDFISGREKVFISDIIFNESTQEYSMLIAVPIIDDRNGEVMGSIKTLYNIEEIFKIIKRVSIGKTGHANLIASDGTVIVCPIFPPRSHIINEPLLRQISALQPGWGIAEDDAHGEKKSIIGFSPVKTTLEMGKDNFGGKGWYIFIRQLPEETYAPLYALLWKVSHLGFFLVGLLLFLGYFIAKRIVNPIKVLSEEARLIGHGHLDHELKITTGDEIEDLADIFNQMARDLEKRFQEIGLERDKLNTVMNSMGDGLVILDKDLTIQYMNENFLKLYGKETIGKPCREIFGQSHKRCEECTFKKDVREIKPHTAELVTPDGRTCLVTHSSFMNMDGTKSFVNIFKDITERKRLEQQLLNSERLAALSQFSSTFAHDLRNPVLAIKKTLEMLRDSPGSFKEETTKRVYADLISTCGLLIGLVNDVLDIHQVSYRELPLLFSSFSLREALDEAIKLLMIETEDRKVNIVIEGNDLWMEADKRRIQRVFINLLTNALRYSPCGGNIWISYWAFISHNKQEKKLIFKIEDEGPGIAEDELSKVFDLFYRADKEGIKAGTGLGLYFCKVVVEAHVGRMWAENSKKGGAVFYIEIPLLGRESGGRESDAYQDSDSRRSETISSESQISP